MITLPSALTIPGSGGTETNNVMQLSSVQIDLVARTASFVLAFGSFSANVFTKSSILPTITMNISLSNGIVTLQSTQVATAFSNIDINTLSGQLHDMEFLIEDWLIEKGYLVGRLS